MEKPEAGVIELAEMNGLVPSPGPGNDVLPPDQVIGIDPVEFSRLYVLDESRTNYGMGLSQCARLRLGRRACPPRLCAPLKSCIWALPIAFRPGVEATTGRKSPLPALLTGAPRDDVTSPQPDA